MPQSLHLKAFFFNSKTDYLPYYKQFDISLAEDAKAKDILLAIQAQNDDFNFPDENLIFKINGWVVNAQTTLLDITKKLGTELQIDPVNSYRSMNGLEINDDDFDEAFATIAPFASNEDREYYESLYALHYASESEKFDHEYIGDAVLLTAHKMIEEGSEYKEQILHALRRHTSGLATCEYENNLFAAPDYGKKIEALKAMAYAHKENSFFDKLQNKIFKTEQKRQQALSKVYSIEALETKNIAYYHAGNTEKLTLVESKIAALGSKQIHFQRASKLSGFTLLKSCRAMALKKAGTTLLDAFDCGAEVLVVQDKNLLVMFRENHKAIEKVLGREYTLELLSYDDFILQADLIVA